MEILADDWKFTPQLRDASGFKTTECPNDGDIDKLWVGGPNKFGEKDSAIRKYTNLPSHTWVYFSIEGIAIDKWQNNDYFSILFDGIVYGTWFPGKAWRDMRRCGNTLGDFWSEYIIRLPHEGDTLKVEIKLNITSSLVHEASFAFRNVRMTMTSVESPGGIYINFCQNKKCAVNNKTMSGTTCEPDEYWTGYGTACDKCNLACQSCSKSNSPEDCNYCAPGYSFDGVQCTKNTESATFCELQNFRALDQHCEKCSKNFVLKNDGNCVEHEGLCPTREFGFGTVYKRCLAYCDSQITPYFIMNLTCISKCPSPMISEPITIEPSSGLAQQHPDQPICYYPGMQKRIDRFVSWDKQIVDSCDSVLSIYGWDIGIQVCARCQRGEFLYPNGSCSKVSCEDNKKYQMNIHEFGIDCMLICSDPQTPYFYNNGSCQKDCPSPFIIVDDVFCRSPIIIETLIGDTPLTLGLEERWTEKAEDEILIINGESYHLNSTWTLFDINYGHFNEYTRKTYGAGISCGCASQICGTDCSDSIYCSSNQQASEKKICWPWDTMENFCWSLNVLNEEKFKAYPLTPVSIISIMDYNGLVSQKGTVSITNRIAPPHQYDLTALITDYQLKNPSESMVFVEETRSLISTDKLTETLKSIPTISVDNNIRCEFQNPHLDMNISLVHKDENTNSFFEVDNNQRIFKLGWKNSHDNVILHSLDNKFLLTPNGQLKQWPMGRDHFQQLILDPCNLQAITLVAGEKNIFYVEKENLSQKLIDNEIICVAVNENYEDEFDLTVYEIRNGTNLWTLSNRLKGFLSRDSIERIKLQITANKNETSVLEFDKEQEIRISLVEKSIIEVQAAKRLKEKISCTIFLSDFCIHQISLSPPFYYETLEIDNCGDLYKRGLYFCEGGLLQGFFILPTQYHDLPISPNSMLSNQISNKPHKIVVNSGKFSPKTWWAFLTFQSFQDHLGFNILRIALYSVALICSVLLIINSIRKLFILSRLSKEVVSTRETEADDGFIKTEQ